MQYYRCKCGNVQAHTSMGVAACTSCPKCGSDLAQGSDMHEEPAPHKFVTRYDQNTGAPYERCTACLRTRSELEAERGAAPGDGGGDGHG